MVVFVTQEDLNMLAGIHTWSGLERRAIKRLIYKFLHHQALSATEQICLNYLTQKQKQNEKIILFSSTPINRLF